MKVSVVIPSYNRPELLYRVLYSLWHQHDSDYEVLVSNDDDPEVCSKTRDICSTFSGMGMPITEFLTGAYKRGVPIGDNAWDTGIGWSVETYPCNVGIRHATGDLILLNSGDVLSVTNTIDQHRQWHLAHPNTFLVSTVHALSSKTQSEIDNYDWRNSPSSLLFKDSCIAMYTGLGKNYAQGDSVATAANPYHFLMSVPKSVLWNIRGFDEDYFGQMCCGDDDLADRLTRSGLTVQYAEQIIAIHQFHGNPNIGSAKSNDTFDSGATLYRQRQKQGVVRNVNHEWGQYPRDMTNLPQISGAK